MKNIVLTSLLFFSIGMMGCAIHAGEIRSYQPSDYSFIHAMLMCNQELLLPGDTLDQRVVKTQRYVSSSNYITKVYVIDGQPAGFITYFKVAHLAPLITFLQYDPANPGPKVSHSTIILLCVPQEHRRCGVGKALMESALQDMRSKNVKVVRIDTETTNFASRSLCERFGFSIFFPFMTGPTDCPYRLIFQ